MHNYKYDLIKAEYDNFYRSLLAKGKLPMWSTKKGFWNASISDEIFEAFKRLKLEKFKNFLNIGSGDGKVTLIASLFCKNAEGIEIDKNLHDKGLEMQRKLDIKNATLHNADFFLHNFSKYDVLFVSPDVPFERGLEKKLLKEMKGKLIHYGHHFHPQNLMVTESLDINGTKVSLYSRKMP